MGDFEIDRILDAGLYTMDGEKVLDLSGLETIETYDSDLEKCEEKCINSFYPSRISARFTVTSVNIKKWIRLAYGWAARGPIRKRAILRAYRQFYRLRKE